ncbi:MAG: type II toxin-antitoxin system HipA family toxin [Candidatus Velthaea sp.]
MKLAPGTPISAAFDFGPGRQQPIGRLALDRQGVTQLEYERGFAASGLSLHPRFGQPVAGLVAARNPRAFRGLHGVFADSLPDAWGLELLRRRAVELGIDFNALRGPDLLACVGSRGPGALTYLPAFEPQDERAIDLDRLAGAAIAIEEGRESDDVAQLFRLGGSSGGARPKILVDLNAAGAMRPSVALPAEGFAPWIIKFRSAHDVADSGPLEAAYADMARAAGLEVAATRLIPAPGGPGFFATKRFDRASGGKRLHLVSAAAILEVDWSIPAFGYEELLKVTRAVTRHQPDVEAAFRRAVFNVVAHNRDDHAKQHAFLMDAGGRWHIAPSYDLTFSRGPGDEHYLTVGGRGTQVSFEDLMALGAAEGIHERDGRAIVEQVREAVSDFRTHAKRYGVTRATTRAVEQGLRP